MKFSELNTKAAEYVRCNAICNEYARQVRNRTARFVEWAQTSGDITLDETIEVDGKTLPDGDVTAARISLYLAALEKTVRPATAKGYRTIILSVLRYNGWTPETRIRPIRMGEDVTDCFTLDEMRSLIKVAGNMQGKLTNGVPHAVFWPLAIHAGYSTGLRYGDLMKIQVADVSREGVIRVKQHKTGKLVAVQLSPDALRLMRSHSRPEVVPWPNTHEHFRVEFKALIIATGVRRGCWKWLRRSAGTYAELESPGRGHRLLGNTIDIFRKHYATWGILTPKPVSPPRL